MTTEELVMVAQSLRDAKFPEDVFGDLSGTSSEQLLQVKKTYQRLARVVHPDKYTSSEDIDIAGQAARKLNVWREEAEKKINSRTYGSRIDPHPPVEPVVISSQKHQYMVGELAQNAGYANLYFCSFEEKGVSTQALFKVAQYPQDNDLIQNEAMALSRLHQDSWLSNPPTFIPELIESFGFKEGGTAITRIANILSYRKGYYTLEDVRKHYPQGVDPKHMAWMFRKLLATAGYSHQLGVIHAAILPSRICIIPEDHALSVVDWSYAVIDPHLLTGRVKAIDPDYERWYPEEVKKKEAPLYGLDIYMIAQCMIYVLGGDPVGGKIPDSVPKSMRAFLRGCLIPSPSMRQQDAWELLKEFDELIFMLWGKRKFIPFSMPPR